MTPSRRYYGAYIDVYVLEKWQLSRPLYADGSWIIPWDLRQGEPVHLEDEPFVPLARPGFALDFTVTAVGIIVINQRLASLWARLDVQKEVQLIPTRVEGQTERYFILNTLNVIRCVDEARCDEVTIWEPHHGESKRMGQYYNVRGLKIDPGAVGDANIFRPWGWSGALIVSERVKRAMDDEGIKGARFIEV